MIILGTGFDTQAMASSVALRGEGGRVLADEWAQTGIQAHRGTMIEGYPNLFFLLGPNTGLGHNSVVFMIECQIRLALQAMERVRGNGAAAIAPRAESQDAYNTWAPGRVARCGLVAELQELVRRRPRPQHHALAA